MSSGVFKLTYGRSKNCFLSVNSSFASQIPENHAVQLISPDSPESFPVYLTCISQPQPSSLQQKSFSDQTVEVSRHFGTLNGFKEDQNVQIEYRPGNIAKVVSQVHVRPFSQSDWDILELNANLVQSNLLNQVRVVWLGAIIPVWINPGTHVAIIIDSLVPGHGFGLLAPMTELIVAPFSKQNVPSIPPSPNSVKTIAESQSEEKSLENPASLSVWRQVKHFFQPNQSHPNPLQEETKLQKPELVASAKGILPLFSPSQSLQTIPLKPLKLRLHPITPGMYNYLESLLLKHYSCGVQPYMAFITRACLDRSVPDLKLPPNYRFLAKLTGKKVTDPNAGIQTQCVVHTFVVDTFPGLDMQAVTQFGLFDSTILLTDSTRRQLRLPVGGFLEICLEDLKLTPEINDIILQPLEKTEKDRKTAIEEFKTWFSTVANDNLPLLLNNHLHVSIQSKKMESSQMNSYAVSLSPDVQYVLLGPGQLPNTSIEVRPFVDHKDLPEQVRFRLPAKETLDLESQQERLSGFDKLLLDGENTLISALAADYCALSRTVSGCRHGNVLVTGQKASGKTSLVKALCKKLHGAPYFVQYNYITCSAIAGKKPETLRQEWSHVLIQALDRQPSVVVLDDLDVICPSIAEGDTGNEAIYSSKVADLLLELVRKLPLMNQVIILAVCASSKLLNSKLYHDEGHHFILHELAIPSPDKSARLQMLQAVTEQKDAQVDVANWDSVLRKTEGFTVSDLHNVAERALQFVKASSIGEPGGRIILQDRHLDEALDGFVPFALMGVTLKPASQDQKAWRDIGGLSHAKKSLIQTLQWPTQYPELFESLPIKLKSGILLYGPPGSGKTLLASAVASECGTSFISVKGPELLSKYIGASEEAVRQTFQRARAAKPCILFFDEFESLAPRRGHDSTGVTDRVVNQLLTELDGVQGPNKGLWVLAATSRPDLIDPALLRPGRFDVLLNCPLPDHGERLEILQLLSQKACLCPEVCLDEIASLTEHYSGADLQGLLYTAQLQAINDARAKEPDLNRGLSFVIDQETLLKAVAETQPSVSDAERHQYARICETFGSSKAKKPPSLPTKALATLA